MNAISKFYYLSRVEFFQIRDGLLMVLLERIEFPPRTREFLISKMQIASVLYRIKHGCDCYCTECYEQRPHYFWRHGLTPNRLNVEGERPRTAFRAKSARPTGWAS